MTSNLLLILLLAVAAAVGMWRLRHASPLWRRGLLLALQPTAATLLYFALMPPSTPGATTTMVVLTAGSRAQAYTSDQFPVVALPEATVSEEIERAPDLATALRRHPGTSALRIVGAGLLARDRDAVQGLALTFDAPSEVAGLAELSAPPLQAAGAVFQINGRVAGIPGARVSLVDPAGNRVQTARVGQDGRFSLEGVSRAAGAFEFSVIVLDATGRQRDSAMVPVLAVDPPTQHVLLVGGAPQPEWKYLRRWASDAGLQAQTRLALGGGVQLGDTDVRLDRATFDKADLVVIDERALASLASAQRDALLAAVDRGLGLLVRVSGPLDNGQRQALAALGLPMRGASEVAPILLEAPDAEDRTGAAQDRAGTIAPKTLERMTWQPLKPDLPVLARDGVGEAYAWWRPQGLGRVAVTTLIDSYRLVLGGHADQHAALWSSALSALTRPRKPETVLVGPAWQGERFTLCQLGNASQLRTAGSDTVERLLNTAGCAAVWPGTPGWHYWELPEGQRGAVYVRAAASHSALHQNATRSATLGLVDSEILPFLASPAPQPGARWPWWLAFVLCASLSWWIERQRPLPRPAMTTEKG
jgi:hypothetical protein